MKFIPMLLGCGVCLLGSSCSTPAAGSASPSAGPVPSPDLPPPSNPGMESAAPPPAPPVRTVEPGPEPTVEADPLCDLQGAWRRATPEQKEEFRRWMKDQPE